MKSLKLILGTFAALAFTAGSLSAAPVNDICPVSGKEVDEEKVVEVSVGFCCEKCKSKFDAAPADFYEKIAAAEEGKCPVSGEANDEDQTSTVSVGVCCGKCETKMKDAPKEFIGKVKNKETAKEGA